MGGALGAEGGAADVSGGEAREGGGTGAGAGAGGDTTGTGAGGEAVLHANSPKIRLKAATGASARSGRVWGGFTLACRHFHHERG